MKRSLLPITVIAAAFFFTTVTTYGQDIVNKGNGTKQVTVFSVEELLKAQELTSIEVLNIDITKKLHKKITLSFREPEKIKSISIHYPEQYVFKDSFPNITYIGIESYFKGTLNLKIDPNKLRFLSIYNYRTSDYSLISKFKNLDSLQVGLKKAPENLIKSIASINTLKYLLIGA